MRQAVAMPPFSTFAASNLPGRSDDQARAELLARRRSALAAEARRLDRRRSVAESVSLRCEAGQHGLGAEQAGALRLRLLRRATTLRMRFHRTIDALVMAGGFDEAIGLLRARSASPAGLSTGWRPDRAQPSRPMA